MNALPRFALALGVALGSLALRPATAHAGNCVKIDEERDTLSPEERSSARTLFEDALSEEHQEVSRDNCTETWTVYHIRLGESLTAVVQSPRGSRRERVNKVEDLPPLYSQMVRSLLSGTQMTNESGNITRKNVTEAQNKQVRVRADAIWYAKLGYGATTADGFHSGPEFGFGRRWELDSIGIDLAFFNFLLYQNADGFKGLSAGWVELAADYFFDAFGNSSPYVGAGLSLGSHSVPSDRGDYEGSGLQAKATLGYEMFRASTIRLLLQADAILPMYRLSRTTTGQILDVGDVETKSHTYAPNLMLSLGLGWGSSSE
jgi:hypothetical protein